MKRTPLIVAAVLALLVALAAPASANTATSCTPGGTVRLSVTRYPYGSGVQYHMDLNSAGNYHQDAIYFDGVRQSGTNDIYKNVSGGTHTIKGQWFYSVDVGWYVSCSRSL